MAISIVILILILATVLFHFLSPWWFTPLASNWSSIDGTIDITLWVTGVVFVLVNLFLAYAVYRYRYKKDQTADYEPENKKLETWLTIITTIGVAAMLAPGLVVWSEFVHVPEDAKEFEVVGQQWSWNYRFPGEDGVLGKTDNTYTSSQNPFGIIPSDPNGQDDVLINSNEVHLPINQPVKVLQRSKDVLHNFAIPQFRVKMDLVPGITSYFWFTPTKLGTFDVLCQELCGIAHYLMRGKVVVQTEADFNLWLSKFPTFAESLQLPKGDVIAGKQFYQACAACHGTDGQGNKAMNAPKLAGLSSWYSKRQLEYFKHNIRGSSAEDTYGVQMAAMTATLPDDKAITDVSAYIQSLPIAQQIQHSTADINKGAILYRNCGFCHGNKGQGNYALNAPRLAGQHDWYLKRQLLNFKNDIRGKHTDDLYGKQMVLMSRLLQNDEAIDQVIAYINQLQPIDSEQNNAVLQE
ncbi:cytochrome c oxidase subunit II [Thalassotalea nanhaiensis]|uniref:cytochrome-c oxidase n=1 Tax=Thalassotalea nanhaiensis TaxID=3065648 RepID=A0ABY9TG15_9GAMM|nr:cytochrome c oxidase subunit II [Colwelliaceae bacterium SQ345]